MVMNRKSWGKSAPSTRLTTSQQTIKKENPSRRCTRGSRLNLNQNPKLCPEESGVSLLSKPKSRKEKNIRKPKTVNIAPVHDFKATRIYWGSEPFKSDDGLQGVYFFDTWQITSSRSHYFGIMVNRAVTVLFDTGRN
jgi:hypothetical protein